MRTGEPLKSHITFDMFEVDLHTQELRRDGRALRLPNQSFLVLAALLERPGELVTREVLQQRLWPSERFIDTEQSLNAAVNRLREALRDSASQPKYIETLPRRGYRFIGKLDVPELSGRKDEPAVEQANATKAPASFPRERIAIVGVAVALLASAGFFAVWFTRGPSESADRTRVVPFTTLPNQEIAPAYSPDGQQIVFAWNGESRHGFDLYIKQQGVEKALPLTRRPSQWISAAWSPDGKHIAFARASEAEGGIYLISAPLGGNERRLASATIAASPLSQVSWSADGTQLIYSAFGERGTLQLYSLDVDAPAPKRLTVEASCWDLGSPAYAPDGERIAFVCTRSFGVHLIYSMSSHETVPKMLTRVMGTPKGLAWSADGEHIIFANDAGDGGGLWQVTLEGKLSRLPFGEEAITPTASSTREQIAYARLRERINIWRLDLRSTSSTRSPARLISSTRIQMNPQYSPDGSRIAFQSTRSGSSEIWIAQSDGSDPVQVSAFSGPIAGAPSWCSDGKRLAFDSRASGVSALYIAHTEEWQPRMIQTSVQNLALPVWSGDCRWLLASDGNNSLFIVAAEGGEAKRFTQRPSYYARVIDEDVIFNVKEANGVSLWRKRIGTEQEHPVEGMAMLSYNDGWYVTPEGIFFTRASADSTVVRFYDFQTRSIREVAQLTKPPHPAGGLGLSVSSDGHSLLYTQVEEQESDIMVVLRE